MQSRLVPQQPQSLQPLSRVKTPLVRAVGIALIGMTVFEAVQSHFVPQITLWPSQVMAIFFSGLTAAVAAAVAIQHQHRLQRQFLADIRTHGRAEESLRENQRALERLLDTSPDVVYLYDVIEQRIWYINQ
jgi:PAS domain-containing protein